MKRIADYPVYYRGIIVAHYIIEESASRVYYVWRTDMKLNHVRNVWSTPYKLDAEALAYRYALIASI